MRAQIPLNFLVSILIALIILIPSMLIISKCTRLTDQGERSFDNLVTKINNLNEGEITQAVVYMDKGTRIVAFEAGANQVDYDVSVHSACRKDWEVKRPKACDEGKTCICRCKDDDSSSCEKSDCQEITSPSGNVALLTSSCDKEVKNVAFMRQLGVTVLNDIVAPINSGVLKESIKYSNCEHGFVMHRYEGKIADTLGVAGVGIVDSPTCAYDIRSTPKDYTIYAEKTASGIKLCTELNELNSCSNSDDLKKGELFSKMKEEVVRKFDNCMQRIGQTCFCDSPTFDFVKDDYSLLIETKDSKTEFTILKGGKPLSEKATSDGEFCIYDINSGTETSNRQDFSIPLDNKYLIEFEELDGDIIKRLAMIKVGNKVCIAKKNGKYVFDSVDNIQDGSGNTVIPACDYK